MADNHTLRERVTPRRLPPSVAALTLAHKAALVARLDDALDAAIPAGAAGDLMRRIRADRVQPHDHIVTAMLRAAADPRCDAGALLAYADAVRGVAELLAGVEAPATVGEAFAAETEAESRSNPAQLAVMRNPSCRSTAQDCARLLRQEAQATLDAARALERVAV